MEISRARHYCGYQIRAEPLEDRWRVVVQPSRPGLPILSERVFPRRECFGHGGSEGS
jgi:hypothetical protein